MGWKQLDRRAFLRGTGMTLSLPLLEAMLPFRQALAATVAPTRSIIVNFPYGTYLNTLQPGGSATSLTLPSVYAALEPYKGSMTGVRRLFNYWGSVDGAGDHARGDGTYLTCVHINKSETDIRDGISVDQVMANAIGNQTRVKSAYIWDGSTGGGDSGYSSAYKNMSWVNATTPNSPINNPQKLFDSLLAGATSTPPTNNSAAMLRLKKRQSVLDGAIADVNRLMSTLGTTDKAKLDQYLTSVRTVETDIVAEINRQPAVASCTPGTRPGTGLSFPAKTKLNFDIITLAMQCDSTRIFMYQVGSPGNVSNLGIGLSGDHHNDFSHYSGQTAIDGIYKINTWYAEQFAYFLGKLSSTADVDGKSLLYNSIVTWGSELRDSNQHDDYNIPLYVCGNGGGKMTPGKMLDPGKDTPMANAWLSVMKMMGVNVASFGEGQAISTGTLAL